MERQSINYGIRTGSVNNLYIVDLDGPEAQQWWKSTGFHDGAIVSTPSGPERTHHYFRIDGETELPNTKKKLHHAVDTRGEGGLVPGPGSMLETGTYIGDISHIPEIPEGLLAILPEKQVYSTEEFAGEQVDAASPAEERQVNAAIAALEALPRVWTEGSGWRSEMFRVGCWLSRMANSAAYAMTQEAARSIIIEHTPTDSEWGIPQILEQWHSAIESTLGQFADLPIDEIPNLLPIIETLNALPESGITSSGELFTSLIFDAPEGDPSEWWKRRRTILVECFRAGLSAEQAVTIAWGSVAGQPIQSEMNGLVSLWREAEKARASVAAEQGAGTEAPADHERPNLALVSNRIELLTAEERAWLASPVATPDRSGELKLNGDWWGTRYLEWAASRVSLMNSPYHEINIWTILSVIFSPFGFIPHPAKPIGLNLFVNLLGKSTTGKSESVYLMLSVLKAFFPAADSPSIGGNASPNALINKLIERDGKSSLFITDEAHGLFKQMQGDGSWMSGLKELLAALFEGDVPVVLRNGNKDVSGVDASTFFNAHLAGTVDGMTKALDEEMWISGLLPRFIWAVGAEVETTPDTYAFKQVDGYSAGTYDAMPKQWAAEFMDAHNELRNLGTLPLAVLHDQEAGDRHGRLQEQLHFMSIGHRQEDLLRPTLIRFGTNIRKCAILAALVEGSNIVTIRHELIALRAAEDWINNIFLMVDQTTATAFSRSVDDVEKFIAAQKGQEIRIERVYSRFKQPVRFMDEWITQLTREGRVSKLSTKDESFTLKIKTQQQTGALAA